MHMPRVVGGSQGGGRFLMGEVPMYGLVTQPLPSEDRTSQKVVRLFGPNAKTRILPRLSHASYRGTPLIRNIQPP